MSDSNPDAPDARSESNKSRDDGHNDQSASEHWILISAAVLLAFGVLLLVLRSVLFSLILITVGISLFAYWLYVGVRESEQRRLVTDHARSSSSAASAVSTRDHVCTCSICKHTESSPCLEMRCPCCILTRNNQIIGHFNNPVQ
jgi:MMPL family